MGKLDLLKKSLRKGFARNVLILASGTTLAQVIPILITPIITRLYTPEHLGVLSLYISITSILIIFSTGKLELAIMLPDSDKDAIGLSKIASILVIAVSFLLFIPCLFYDNLIADVLSEPNIGDYIKYVPVGVFCFGLYQIFYYIQNRYQGYKNIASSKLISASSTSVGKIVLGLLDFKVSGLVFSTILGHLSSMISVFYPLAKSRVFNVKHSVQELFGLLRRYKHFPIMLLPSHAISVIRQQIPILAITKLFGISTLGLFGLANQLINLPSVLVANAIGDVYRQRATEEFRKHGKFDRILLSTLRYTVVIAVIPFTLLYFFSPFLFTLVFGEAWKEAGDYASILVISGFFSFIFTPIDKGALIVEATKYILAWHVSLLSFQVLAYIISMQLSLEIKGYLYLYTLINLLHYLLDFIVGLHFSRGRTKNNYVKKFN